MMTRLVNLDLDLLRALVAVADAKSFTRAGERLNRSQSTVSLQISRLEAQIGARLLSRDPRHVALTPAGEALLPRARRLLHMNDELVQELSSAELEGEVRFGAPEDFATVHLPEILGRFAALHPKVRLNVTCDLTLNLMDQMSEGRLDLCLVKREPLGPDLGVRVWREPLVWVAANEEVLEREGPLPLVVAPSPCVYRKRAVTALEAHSRDWRVAYTSPSLAGQHAALRAGLGLSVLPREMAPRDLRVLSGADGLPDLHEAEIALLKSRAPSRATEALSTEILQSLGGRA